MRSSKSQIPVFLLTGFLGAGKTTLLNRMLEDPALKNTALVINEFGLVPIDHDLVREGRERPMVTSAGCICCTIGSDLRSSLAELLEEQRKGEIPQIERVIVETTGLADPAPIINSLIPGGIQASAMSDHWVAKAFRLSGVITVIDAETIEPVLDAHPESLRQIAFADHGVITRSDQSDKAALETSLRQINPQLKLHDVDEDGFDPSSLIQLGSYSALGKGEDVVKWLEAESADDHDHHHHHDHGHDHAHHNHHDHDHDRNRHGDVLALALASEKPLNAEALEQFLTILISSQKMSVLRIKGLVALQDDPASPAVIHSVQHRLYPTLRLDQWPEGWEGSRLVVIGSNLDEEALQRAFAQLR